MADRVVYVCDYDTGELIPLAYVDNGDGTYSRKVRNHVDGLVTKKIYRIDANTGALIPIELVQEPDGSYATLASM